MTRLAINGGPPAVTQPRPHYVWPPITDRTRAAVLEQLDESISIYDRSGILETLEDRLASYYGVRHAVLMNSGTAALHALYAACGIGEGDEVLCPAYTFFATATPLHFLGATPVLVDCGPDGNIDPADARRKMTARTRAIVVTHMWGMPCDMAPLAELSREYGVDLLEDTSHAHGARYHGRPVGTFGRGAAMSIQGQKTLTGGEGGVVLTDDDEVYYQALMFGHYNKRCRNEIPSGHPLHDYAITGMGLKLRIHPLAAAIANEQLDGLDDLLERRRAVARRMQSLFEGFPGLQVPREPEGVQSSWYAFVMQYVPTGDGALSRDRLYDALRAEGCDELDRPSSTRPLHLLPLFQRPGALFPRIKTPPATHAPTAEAYHQRALKLPVWHDDDSFAVSYADAFQKVFHHSPSS